MSIFMCRTCLYTNHSNECFKNVETVKNILKHVVPEITLLSPSLICFRCYNFLKTVEHFKLKCIEVQKQLIDFNVMQLLPPVEPHNYEVHYPSTQLLINSSKNDKNLQKPKKTVIMKTNVQNYQNQLEEYIKQSLKTTAPKNNKPKNKKMNHKRTNLLKSNARNNINNRVHDKQVEKDRNTVVPQEHFHVHSQLTIIPISTSNSDNLFYGNSCNLICDEIPKDIQELKKKSKSFQRLKNKVSKQMNTDPYELTRIYKEVETDFHRLIAGARQNIMLPVDASRSLEIDKTSKQISCSVSINTSRRAKGTLVEPLTMADRLSSTDLNVSPKNLNLLNPSLPEMNRLDQIPDSSNESNRLSQDQNALEVSRSRERNSQEIFSYLEGPGGPNPITNVELCNRDEQISSNARPKSNEERQLLPQDDLLEISDTEVEINDSSTINEYHEEDLDEDDIFEENKITIVKHEPEVEKNPSFFNKCSDSGFYSCKLCTKEYKNSKGLYEHTQRKHAELKFYHCEICNFFTLWKSALSRHTTLFHESAEVDMLDYKYCYHCTFKTTSKSVLAKHVHNLHFTQTVLEV